MRYQLEPAGSKGAWGLDDYHFIPFILGGAELIDHPVVKLPSDVHNDSFVDAYHTEFMYLSRL